MTIRAILSGGLALFASSAANAGIVLSKDEIVLLCTYPENIEIARATRKSNSKIGCWMAGPSDDLIVLAKAGGTVWVAQQQGGTIGKGWTRME